MFRNVRVPILGIIENMSYYQCPNCGHSAHIFGRDGAKRTAEDFNMELLGQVSPLSILIITWGSSWVPAKALLCASVHMAGRSEWRADFVNACLNNVNPPFSGGSASDQPSVAGRDVIRSDLIIVTWRGCLGYQRGRHCGRVCTDRSNAGEVVMLSLVRGLGHLQVPLEIGIRETSDAGAPIVASQPESKEAQVYASIAERVKQKLDRYATLREDQQKAQTSA